MEKNEYVQGDGRKQVYEIGFHIVPIVSVDALPAEVQAIRSLIEQNGGALISEDMPKPQALAYPIARMVGGKREWFDTAHFGWIKFEAEPIAVEALKTGIEKNTNILRHLIIKTVRENTLYKERPTVKVEKGEVADKADKADKTDKVSKKEIDIDKTIDAMVTE